MPYANKKGADQPVHPHSLIIAFVVHCLDSIIPHVSISDISCLFLASVAEQVGLSVTWSQTLKTDFLVMRLIFMRLIHQNNTKNNSSEQYKMYQISKV